MLTIESLVDRIEPYLKRAIDSEVPFGFRFVAHRLARWKIRKTLEAVVALHGHQVSPVVGALQPLGEHIFRPEVNCAMADVKSICDTPVTDFGPWATDARQSAGPTPTIRR